MVRKCLGPLRGDDRSTRLRQSRYARCSLLRAAHLRWISFGRSRLPASEPDGDRCSGVAGQGERGASRARQGGIAVRPRASPSSVRTWSDTMIRPTPFDTTVRDGLAFAPSVELLPNQNLPETDIPPRAGVTRRDPVRTRVD